METTEERIRELEAEIAARKAILARPRRAGNHAEQQEALNRAQSCRSLVNMATVIQGFAARGIPADEIKPGENCLTYNAWLALGRHVKRGEHGVKVATMAPCTKQQRDETTGETSTVHYKRPWTATVFHISQTEE
jgi:antirestriction protein ArdC